MLLTKNIENPILFEPALRNGLQCDSLKIVTGFTDCGRILTHLIALKDGSTGQNKEYVSKIKISIILGMTKGNSLTLKKHKSLCSTIKRINQTFGMPKVSLCYIYVGQEVHSKVYLWSRKNVPTAAFCGSANYTINAFYKRRECMNPCLPEDALEYYNELKNDAVDCFDKEIEKKIQFSSKEIVTDEIDDDNLENLRYEDFDKKEPIDTLTVSLLTSDGEVGYGSGINWGIRRSGLKRDPDQAYIPYNKQDRKAGFFPGKANPEDKHCRLFKAVTKDAGAFYMRLAQANNKGIYSADSNAILGKWIRDKIGAASGTFVTKEMLEKYGASSVVFRKYEDDIYLLDFEPREEKQ